jgi:hypothetical protein
MNVETSSQAFDVLLYHDITVISENETHHFRSSVANPGEVPRAPEHLREVGALIIACGQREHLFELHEITFGKVMGLPPYNPDRPVVVSKPTIAAAVRAGRPVDDLLYPYQPIRDPVTNDFLGVKGLAHAVPTPRQRALFMDTDTRWPEGVIRLDPADIINTCPYDVKLFGPESADPVARDTLPLFRLPRAEAAVAADIIYDERLDTSMTERLEVPIYETRALSLENDWSEVSGTGWHACHIDTPVIARNPSPQHVIVHDLVRDAGGYMLGGREFARISPKHFTEPLI